MRSGAKHGSSKESFAIAEKDAVAGPQLSLEGRLLFSTSRFPHGI